VVSELVPVGTSACEGIAPAFGVYHIQSSLRDVHRIGVQLQYHFYIYMSTI
jgi:hypothetical protein